MDSVTYLDPTLTLMLLCVGVLCFFIGSWFSPQARVERAAKKTWEGYAGIYKRRLGELEAELANADPLDGLLKSIPMPYRLLAKPLLNWALANPTQIVGVAQRFAPTIIQNLAPDVAKTLGITDLAPSADAQPAGEVWK